MIPAELSFRPDFFGLISGRFSQEAARGIGITMAKVQSLAGAAHLKFLPRKQRILFRNFKWRGGKGIFQVASAYSFSKFVKGGC